MTTFIYYLGAFTFCSGSAAALLAVIDYLDRGCKR